jgi:hypothetical protein
MRTKRVPPSIQWIGIAAAMQKGGYAKRVTHAGSLSKPGVFVRLNVIPDHDPSKICTICAKKMISSIHFLKKRSNAGTHVQG